MTPAQKRANALTRDAWLRGFASALAEMHRGLIAAGHDENLVRCARAAGLTLAEVRRLELLSSDIERLQRAGLT